MQDFPLALQSGNGRRPSLVGGVGDQIVLGLRWRDALRRKHGPQRLQVAETQDLAQPAPTKAQLVGIEDRENPVEIIRALVEFLEGLGLDEAAAFELRVVHVDIKGKDRLQRSGFATLGRRALPALELMKKSHHVVDRYEVEQEIERVLPAGDRAAATIRRTDDEERRTWCRSRPGGQLQHEVIALVGEKRAERQGDHVQL